MPLLIISPHNSISHIWAVGRNSGNRRCCLDRTVRDDAVPAPRTPAPTCHTLDRFSKCPYPYSSEKGNLPPLKQLQLRRRQQLSAAFLNLVAHLLSSLEGLVNPSTSSQCSEHLLASLDCLVHLEILIGCYICPWTLLHDHPRSLPAASDVSPE